MLSISSKSLSPIHTNETREHSLRLIVLSFPQTPIISKEILRLELTRVITVLREAYELSCASMSVVTRTNTVNPLNPELNPICYLLALLGAHHFLHVSRIRVKSLTLRLLMSYIYVEHLFLMFLDHTQRRTTVGRTPLDE